MGAGPGWVDVGDILRASRERGRGADGLIRSAAGGWEATSRGLSGRREVVRLLGSGGVGGFVIGDNALRGRGVAGVAATHDCSYSVDGCCG